MSSQIESLQNTQDLRNTAAITGIGESEYTDGGGNTAEKLIFEACQQAIDNAGLSNQDIDGVVVEGNMMPDTVTPAELSEVLDLNDQYRSLSLTGGAGPVASPLLAAQAIENGLANHVISYFGVDWASQLEAQSAYEGGPYSYHTDFPVKTNTEVPFGWVTQPVYVASEARRHMHEYGTTRAQLGEVAIQTRQNALENSKALKTDPLSEEEYLDNPIIADPFKILDCCLISDGAGAFVVSSAEDAESGPHPPVYVQGVGMGFDDTNEHTFMTQHSDFTSLPSKESGPRAFEMAGITPAEVDFAELYDCFTITTIMQLEDLGFCEKGDGGRFVQEKGITVEDGDLPVNTHGGLLSQAYILDINHLTEAVKQLRHEADNQVDDAETGVVTGWGGCEHATLVLGRNR